jgi:hypothetical protein
MMTSAVPFALSVVTSDDWASCAVDVDDGGGANGWAPASTVHDAKSAIEDFAAWIDLTFGATTTTTATAAGASIDLGGGSWLYVANAPAQALLGLLAGDSGLSSFDLAPPSLLTAQFGTVGDLISWKEGRRMAGSSGAVCAEPPGMAPLRPRAVAFLSAVQAAQWRTIVATATNPRQAYLWIASVGAWSLVSLGRSELALTSGNLYRLTPEVLG